MAQNKGTANGGYHRCTTAPHRAPMPKPNMKTETMMVTDSVLIPKAANNTRCHTIWYMSATPPDTKNSSDRATCGVSVFPRWTPSRGNAFMILRASQSRFNGHNSQRPAPDLCSCLHALSVWPTPSRVGSGATDGQRACPVKGRHLGAWAIPLAIPPADLPQCPAKIVI